MRYWTFDEATAALPRVRERVQRMREVVSRMNRRQARTTGNGDGPSTNGHHPAEPEPEAQLLAVLEEFQHDGIVVRDPARGLIDFPARSRSGRDYLLCWLDGEDAIEWWHYAETGFAGRTPLTEPPD
jgi:hypothetical protein